MNAYQKSDLLEKWGMKYVGYVWLSPDGEIYASGVSYADAVNRAYEKYQAEAEAPAPVDILAEKNERISILTAERDELQFRYDHANLHVAELMKENERLSLLLEAVTDQLTQLRNRDMAEQAPHAAPAPAAVTLTDREIDKPIVTLKSWQIEWLAIRQDRREAGVYREYDQYQLVGKSFVQQVDLRDGEEHPYYTLELADEYKTRANYEAIASRRKELGIA